LTVEGKKRKEGKMGGEIERNEETKVPRKKKRYFGGWD
jgi:hypothetical protein